MKKLEKISACALTEPKWKLKIDSMGIKVTIRRVHVTNFGVEKQYVLYILSVCLQP